MATVKLLQAYDGRPAGSKFSSSDTTTDRLIREGKATADLAGSFNFPTNEQIEIVGPYPDLVTLEAAYPAASSGTCLAWVGAGAPYSLYVSDSGTYRYVSGPGVQALVSGAWDAAPATLDGTSAAHNGGSYTLAAGGTLTIGTGAKAVLGAGLILRIGTAGNAMLAFSGGAVKENSSGTSAAGVTLLAGGIYTLLPGEGADAWRLTGGASL